MPAGLTRPDIVEPNCHQHHNLFSDSASAMAAILALHFPKGDILDVTYGLGAFYKLCPHRRVESLDLRPPARIIGDNTALPFRDDSYDVGVLDPPYKRGTGNDRYTERYGKAPNTEQKCTRLYFAALPELLRVCRQGLIVKCQDASDGHMFHCRHQELAAWVKTRTGLGVHDIAIVGRRGVPDSKTNGRRHFLQQSISYFLVWKWRRKSPWKPWRF
jgi:hypothetical protein